MFRHPTGTDAPHRTASYRIAPHLKVGLELLAHSLRTGLQGRSSGSTCKTFSLLARNVWCLKPIDNRYLYHILP